MAEICEFADSQLMLIPVSQNVDGFMLHRHAQSVFEMFVSPRLCGTMSNPVYDAHNNILGVSGGSHDTVSEIKEPTKQILIDVLGQDFAVVKGCGNQVAIGRFFIRGIAGTILNIILKRPLQVLPLSSQLLTL